MRTTLSIPPARRRRRGVARAQALVEFAIIGPFFLALLFFVAEAALYVNALATVDNATRQGARVAAMCGSAQTASVTYYGASASDCGAAATETVLNNLGILSRDGGNPQVVPSGGAPPGGSITLTTTYQYSFYVSQFLGIGPSLTISSTATVVSQQ